MVHESSMGRDDADTAPTEPETEASTADHNSQSDPLLSFVTNQTAYKPGELQRLMSDTHGTVQGTTKSKAKPANKLRSPDPKVPDGKVKDLVKTLMAQYNINMTKIS